MEPETANGVNIMNAN